MSTTEAYLRAITGTSMRIDLERHTSADTIIAAGMSVRQHRHRDLALRVWRLRTQGDMKGARQLAEDLAPIMMRMSMVRKGKPTVTRIQAIDLALETMKWWCMQTCPVCHGRGHPVIPNTPTLDTTRECNHCDGTGIRPMKRYVKNHALAEKLVDHLNELSRFVFSDMAKKLAKDMEL